MYSLTSGRILLCLRSLLSSTSSSFRGSKGVLQSEEVLRRKVTLPEVDADGVSFSEAHRLESFVEDEVELPKK